MSIWNIDTRYNLLYDIFPPQQKKFVWERRRKELMKNKGMGENTNQ